MAQTPPPHSFDQEEKPRAMLFDGWDFVPLPEAEPSVAPAETQPDLPQQALA